MQTDGDSPLHVQSTDKQAIEDAHRLSNTSFPALLHSNSIFFIQSSLFDAVRDHSYPVVYRGCFDRAVFKECNYQQTPSRISVQQSPLNTGNAAQHKGDTYERPRVYQRRSPELSEGYRSGRLRQVCDAPGTSDRSLSLSRGARRACSRQRYCHLTTPILSRESERLRAVRQGFCWTVLWDLENVAIPKEVNGAHVVRQLRAKLGSVRGMETNDPIRRILAITNVLRLRVALRNALQANGVSLHHVETKGRKEAADKALISELCLINCDQEAPSGIALISGDQDFAYPLSRMRNLGFMTVVITPLRNSSSSLLTSVPDVVWSFHDDILQDDKKPTPQSATRQVADSASPNRQNRRNSSPPQRTKTDQVLARQPPVNPMRLLQESIASDIHGLREEVSSIRESLCSVVKYHKDESLGPRSQEPVHMSHAEPKEPPPLALVQTLPPSAEKYSDRNLADESLDSVALALGRLPTIISKVPQVVAFLWITMFTMVLFLALVDSWGKTSITGETPHLLLLHRIQATVRTLQSFPVWLRAVGCTCVATIMLFFFPSKHSGRVPR